MIPIPAAVQPWMIKGGAIALLLSAVFFGGCNTQKRLDAAKIQRLKADYTRAVGIIETFQENYDALDQAIKDTNAEITRQGEEFKRKEAAVKVAYDRAKRNLTASYEESLRTAEEEAADLRARMVGLSVGEACHAAMEEIARPR